MQAGVGQRDIHVQRDVAGGIRARHGRRIGSLRRETLEARVLGRHGHRVHAADVRLAPARGGHAVVAAPEGDRETVRGVAVGGVALRALGAQGGRDRRARAGRDRQQRRRHRGAREPSPHAISHPPQATAGAGS
jgi:hypothetical protein